MLGRTNDWKEALSQMLYAVLIDHNYCPVDVSSSSPFLPLDTSAVDNLIWAFASVCGCGVSFQSARQLLSLDECWCHFDSHYVSKQDVQWDVTPDLVPAGVHICTQVMQSGCARKLCN